MTRPIPLLFAVSLQAGDRPLDQRVNLHAIEGEREFGAVVAAENRKGIQVA